jgi:hypothetical protein
MARASKNNRRHKANPYMVTTGGQAVPQFRHQQRPAFYDSGKHTQRQEEQGTRYKIVQTKSGVWEIINASTGRPTGKYATSAERAQEVLARMLRRTNPHRDRTQFERELEEMRDLGEVYEPKPFPRPTGGMAMKAAASKSKSAYRDRWGRVKMLTEAQAATLPYRAYQKIASNPKSSGAAEKALEHAAAAAIEELRGMIKRSKNPMRRNPSPVPGISVEEVIADVQGEEWANWDYNRAGIMHWR